MKLAFACLPWLFACGAPSAARPTAPASAPKDLPPLYAGLFRDGATWTLPAELRVEGAAPKQGTVTCSVRGARAIHDGHLAELRCDARGVELVRSPSGTYVGTARGLWQVDAGFDGDVASLWSVPRILSPEGDDANQPPDTPVLLARVVAYAGGWCATVPIGDDEGGWTLCLRGGAVIGGGGYDSAAPRRELSFGDAPRE